MRKKIITALIVFTAVAGPAGAKDSTAAQKPAQTLNESKEAKQPAAPAAKMSKEEAEKIALQAVGGGIVFDSELMQEKGRLIYSFDISQKKLIKDVKVDAQTGAVVSTTTETVEHERQEQKEEKEHAAKSK